VKSSENILWRVYGPVEFSAAHFIKGHPKCGIIHGHNYEVVVKAAYYVDDWVDFGDIKATVENVIKDYDHRDLGNITSEELAERIVTKLLLALDKCVGVKLTLRETKKFAVVVTKWKF